MTEREKMLAGKLYNCGDQKLLAQLHKAKDLTKDNNNIRFIECKGKKNEFWINY